MTKSELLKLCCDFLDDYAKTHVQEAMNAIVDGIKDSDDATAVAMKMAMNSAFYASQISTMTLLSFLIELGVLIPSELDAAELPRVKFPLS